jgi:hypothetical protein
MASDVERAREVIAEWHRRKGCNQQIIDDCLSGNIQVPEFYMELLCMAVTQPAASGEVTTGTVNGYLPRKRAVEVLLDGYVPEWLTKFPPPRVYIGATPQPDADTVRDAERYRFIRANASAGTIFCCPLPSGSLNCDEPESEWDAAIDSAIKGEK